MTALPRRLCLVLLCLLLAPVLQAQMPIAKILITNVGPSTVSEALVRANIRLKEGDPYNRAALDDDVRTLYATGFFYNVQIAEKPTDKGMVLTYILQAKPRLTEIQFVGNKK